MVICRTRGAVVLAAILAATGFSAKAQDGDIAAGHAFAREACKACHMVEPEESSPRSIVIGPAFRDIANTGDDGDGHPGVPHQFTPQDAKSDPHTGGDRGCERVYPESSRASLSKL
jgi:hypothetical protein